jgi:hypothetical protein
LATTTTKKRERKNHIREHKERYHSTKTWKIQTRHPHLILQDQQRLHLPLVEGARAMVFTYKPFSGEKLYHVHKIINRLTLWTSLRQCVCRWSGIECKLSNFLHVFVQVINQFFLMYLCANDYFLEVSIFLYWNSSKPRHHKSNEKNLSLVKQDKKKKPKTTYVI